MLKLISISWLYTPVLEEIVIAEQGKGLVCVQTMNKLCHCDSPSNQVIGRPS